MNAAPVTKGLVVRQPWATLIALGILTIWTDENPPPEGVIGQRIAIVAADDPPTLMERFGDLRVESTVDGAYALTNYGLTGPADLWHPLPLGAVVCTVTVEDALPIRSSSLGDEPELVDGGHGLRIVRPLSHCAYGWSLDHSVADQLPLGDFTEGRWGWILGDPQPNEDE